MKKKNWLDDIESLPLRRMYEQILEEPNQQNWEPERQMFEQMLKQIEAVATQGISSPRDLKGHYQLNDKVSFDIDAKIDPDWVNNHDHQTPYGNAWDYQNAVINLYNHKNKKLATLRTLAGFVETLEGENHIGKFLPVKKIHPNTQLELFTPNYNPNDKGSFSETINVKNPNGKDRRMTFFYDYAGKEDYKKVLHDLYYTLNPKEKETAAEKLNNLKNRVQEKLDNMSELIRGQKDKKQECIIDDDGRTM